MSEQYDESFENEKKTSFSSNPNKYLAAVNRKRIEDFHNGLSLPKMLHISPTDKCNLRCFYCSSDKRDGDTMTLQYILEGLDALDALYDEHDELDPLESVEITGGGDPQEYEHINELIVELYNRGLAIGMISNAEHFRSKLDPQVAKLLSWQRCSLNWKPRKGQPMDEWPFVVPQLYKPGEVGRPGTMGFSIVLVAGEVEQSGRLGEKKLGYIETPREHFDLAVETLKHYEGDYLRVVTNCLGTSEEVLRAVDKFKGWVDEVNGALGEQKLYWQHKLPTAAEHPCYTGYFRPFVNSDGWVYPCSSCTLSEEQFPKSLRVCRFDEMAHWIRENWEFYLRHGYNRPVVMDPSKESGCVNCTFRPNVKLLNRIANEDGFLDSEESIGPEEVEHEEFI